MASKLTGLEIRREVSCREIRIEDAVQISKQNMGTNYPGSKLSYERSAFVALGILSPGFDYKACALQDLSNSAKAFYREQTGEILVPRGQAVRFSVLVHEAVHALQDQHYGLAAFTSLSKESIDRALAVKSLVEGHAESIESEYLQKFPSMKTLQPSQPRVENQSQLECVWPIFFDELLSFPYVRGEDFVEKLSPGQLRLHFENRDILSSSQVLALTGFGSSSGGNAQRVEGSSFLQLLSPDVKREVYSNSLGEWGIYILLKKLIGRDKARGLAKQVSQDRLLILRSEDTEEALDLVWLIAWKTKEFRKYERVVFDYLNSTEYSPASWEMDSSIDSRISVFRYGLANLLKSVPARNSDIN